MQAKKYLLGAFWAGAHIFACAGQPMKVIEVGAPAAAHRVLIASEPSAFKETIATQIAQRLSSIGVFVRVIDLRDVERESLAQYGSIVLLNALEMMQLDGDVQGFLEGVDETVWDRTILVTTTPHEDWTFFHEEPTRLGVDAITAASHDDNIETVISEVLDRIKQRL